jgi:hypothetical protein
MGEIAPTYPRVAGRGADDDNWLISPDDETEEITFVEASLPPPRRREVVPDPAATNPPP